MIRTMRWPLVLAMLLALSACGIADGSEVDDATRSASDALEGVAELEARVQSLEAEVGDKIDDLDELTEAGSDTKELLRAMRADLADLQERMSKLKARVGSAEGDASSALGQLSGVIEDIDVLTDRLNFHLRRGD